MIKFFRNIRKNLLSEGKTGKYLKYAIGEIILVVIGILIALSINSWNQNRLLKEQSHQVLMNLQEEILKKKAELEESIEYIQRKANTRLDYLNNKTPDLSEADKANQIMDLSTFYTKRISLPIVESELGPNNKIFQWPELTEKLQNLTESVQYYNKGLDYLENDIFSNMIPYVIKKGAMLDVLVNLEMVKSGEYTQSDIYNDRNFKNLVATSTLMIPSLLQGAEEIMNDYDELLLEINKEIEKN